MRAGIVSRRGLGTPIDSETRLMVRNRANSIRFGAFHVRGASRPSFPIRGVAMPIRELGDSAPVDVAPNICKVEPVRRTSDYGSRWDISAVPERRAEWQILSLAAIRHLPELTHRPANRGSAVS